VQLQYDTEVIIGAIVKKTVFASSIEEAILKAEACTTLADVERWDYDVVCAEPDLISANYLTN
jgi:hypothetical protein